MRKSWAVAAGLALIAVGSVYRLASSKARIESELQARERLSVAIPVTVQIIGAGSVSRSFSADGVVGAEKEITVLSQASGQVQKTLVQIGQKVAPGTPLARIDDEVVESQLRMAKTSLANAKRDLARIENLQKTGASTQQSLDQMRLVVESAQASLVTLEKQKSDALVRSPMHGTVSARQAQDGAVLVAGNPVATISDLSTLVLRTSLTEQEITKVRPGMAVKTIFDGTTIEAHVGTIGVSSDLSGRYLVELRLPSTSHRRVRLGSSGTAQFSAENSSGLPVIPRSSLVAGIKDPKVYVIEGNKALLRKVVVALASDDRVSIASGLKDGEQVVLTGQMNLSDGIDVKVIR